MSYRMFVGVKSRGALSDVLVVSEDIEHFLGADPLGLTKEEGSEAPPPDGSGAYVSRKEQAIWFVSAQDSGEVRAMRRGLYPSLKAAWEDANQTNRRRVDEGVDVPFIAVPEEFDVNGEIWFSVVDDLKPDANTPSQKSQTLKLH